MPAGARSPSDEFHTVVIELFASRDISVEGHSTWTLSMKEKRLLNRIKALLRSPDVFDPLRASPNGIRHHDSPSPIVTRAEGSLAALGHVLILVSRWQNTTAGIKPNMLPSEYINWIRPRLEVILRDIWLDLLTWIDFIHPKHRARASAGSNTMRIVILSRLLQHMFELKSSPRLSSLFRETPHLYTMLFDLWLRFDAYFAHPEGLGDDQASDCFTRLVKTIYDYAIWGAGALDPSYNAESADTVALQAALSTVGHHPRRLYRHAIRNAEISAASVIRLPASSAGMRQAALKFHLTIAGLLADRLMPIPNHARDAMIALVRLLRTLSTSATGKEAATLVCGLLHSVWRTADDRRTMVWALRAGALPLMRDLQTEESSSHTVNAIDLVVHFSAGVDVLRALAAGARQSPTTAGEETLGFLDVDAEAWGKARISLLRSSSAVPQTCSYSECQYRDELPTHSLRRCTCFSAWYCSTECQHRDRAAHAKLCAANEIMFSGGAIPLHDAHFLVVCGRAYAHASMVAILNEIHRTRSTMHVAGYRGGSLLYMVSIIFTDLPPTHKIVPLQQALYAEPTVLVASIVSFKGQPTTVIAMHVPLTRLEHAARGINAMRSSGGLAIEDYWMDAGPAGTSQLMHDVRKLRSHCSE
ncbi:hypothetical protein BD626DRAFT_499282 [Schizophyllum amplum]|uniref:MYND-type domain-containing protein n=1 Tax=Schizophyllum amplum TaxID=97359 RepID=A0A550CAV7_9AGAR|nr:hypothetical protein BD626DRAFT_499282 [Auriculariopsis ampla]